MPILRVSLSPITVQYSCSNPSRPTGRQVGDDTGQRTSPPTADVVAHIRPPQDGFGMDNDERDAESAVRARRVTTRPAPTIEGAEEEAEQQTGRALENPHPSVADEQLATHANGGRVPPDRRPLDDCRACPPAAWYYDRRPRARPHRGRSRHFRNGIRGSTEQAVAHLAIGARAHSSHTAPLTISAVEHEAFLGEQYPASLSGGEKRRVAIA